MKDEGLWGDTPPSVALIRARMQDLRLDAFDNARVARICRTINCTLVELCALAGVFGKNRIEAFQRKNKWPPEIALHFFKLERFANEYIFKTRSMPDEQDICA